MNSLILKPTGSHYGREWSGDDFVVLLDREVVGRIMLHPQRISRRNGWRGLKKPCSSARRHWQGSINLRGFFLSPAGARISPEVTVSADLLEYEHAYR